MRSCAQCGSGDREIPSPDGAEHWVVPEFRWLAKGQTEVSARDGRAGWRPRAIQGRPGMERMICRDCLGANALRDEVWRGIRKAARQAEQPEGEGAYWAALCGEGA